MADTKKLYKGFEEPLDPDTGKEMDDKQRSAWQSSIDSRILEVDFKIPDAPTATSMKAIGSPAMEIPTTVGEPEYAKPKEGATGEDVARAGLDVAGSLPVVGEAADLTTMGLDIKKGDYPAAAISGAAVLLPFVSAGMLKKIRSGGTDASNKASDRLNDLEKGLESGSISKEQAQIQANKIQEDFLDDTLDYQGTPYSRSATVLQDLPPNQGPMNSDDYFQVERLLRGKARNETSELLLDLKSRFDPKTGKIDGRPITNPKTRERLRMLRDEMAFEGREDFQKPGYAYTFRDRLDSLDF